MIVTRISFLVGGGNIGSVDDDAIEPKLIESPAYPESSEADMEMLTFEADLVILGSRHGDLLSFV